MKERGLGTPATRADTIDGLIYQKYIDRNQRELVPTAKAEQLLQFLEAVKATDITSPAMTGEWEHQLRLMEQREISAREIHGRDRRGDERHRRTGERFRGRRFGRTRDRYHFTDRRQTAAGNVARIQIARRRVHDLQGHRRPKNGGSGDSRAGRERDRSDRSMGLFPRRRAPVSRPSSSSRKTRRPGNGKPNTISATRPISVRWNRSGLIRRRARNCAKSGSNYVLRERDERRVETGVSRSVG